MPISCTTVDGFCGVCLAPIRASRHFVSGHPILSFRFPPHPVDFCAPVTFWHVMLTAQSSGPERGSSGGSCIRLGRELETGWWASNVAAQGGSCRMNEGTWSRRAKSADVAGKLPAARADEASCTAGLRHIVLGARFSLLSPFCHSSVLPLQPWVSRSTRTCC